MDKSCLDQTLTKRELVAAMMLASRARRNPFNIDRDCSIRNEVNLALDLADELLFRCERDRKCDGR